MIALIAAFVTDIILARDIGGFKSIMENNLKKKDKEKIAYGQTTKTYDYLATHNKYRRMQDSDVHQVVIIR